MQKTMQEKYSERNDVYIYIYIKKNVGGREVGKGRGRQKWSKQLNTIFNVGHLRPQQVSVILVRTIEGRNLSEEFRSFELQLKEHKVCTSFPDKSILTGSFIIVNERNTHGILCEMQAISHRNVSKRFLLLIFGITKIKSKKYPIIVKLLIGYDDFPYI